MKISAAMEWLRANSSSFSGQLLFDEPLARYTYFQIGGPASVLAIPKGLNDLQWLAEAIQQTEIPFFILGKGSNLLISDLGYEGIVIRTNHMNVELNAEEVPSGHLKLRTGTSVPVSSLLKKSAQEGWSGLEFLTGIPGSTGGAVFMNAGTHLGESQSRLTRVEIFSPLSSIDNLIVFEKDQLQFQYRKNLFIPPDGIVWAAEWAIEKGDPAEVKKLIHETLARRKTTQPIEFPSCGSVFKNPKESALSAWQVIDQLGLRGFRIGNAQFAEKHSNFILNLKGAKAKDVKALIDLAKNRAKTEMGIQLEQEVIYLGIAERVS